jgi:hypothetical protein
MMKIKDAEVIMGRKQGYCVHFEVVDGSFFRADSFPNTDAGEPPFASESEAWEMASRFARSSKSVNIYVVNSHDSRPVSGYRERKLNRYP